MNANRILPCHATAGKTPQTKTGKYPANTRAGDHLDRQALREKRALVIALLRKLNELILIERALADRKEARNG